MYVSETEKKGAILKRLPKLLFNKPKYTFDVCSCVGELLLNRLGLLGLASSKKQAYWHV